MNFYSPDFNNHSVIPVKFTADGENACPKFVVEGVPANALSLAIVCHDPDATRGVPWIHWLVWNISPNTEFINDESLPIGSINGITSFGVPEYGGPSPSSGSGPHRYIFTLYALTVGEINLKDKTSLEEINASLEPFTISKSSWIGTYERL